MKICFIEDKSIINHDQYVPLGKLTCEQLNGTSWKEHGLLGAQLDFFYPGEEITVRQFLAQIENAQKTVDQMKAFLNGNSYYQLNDEAVNTFTAVEELLSETRRQMEKKMHTGEEYVLDLGIEIDDLIKQTYTRVYKKYVARRRAQAITDAQFAAWSAEAKKLRTQAYATGMHEEAFRLQLDELMENIKGK